MQPFTVHWAPVSADAARRYAPEGFDLLALWPSPVNDDVCFRTASFTVFGNSDETWDVNADAMLTRLLAELSAYGHPHLESKPMKKSIAWYLRPFTKPEHLDLRKQIELSIQWDGLPNCVVGFGDSGVSLRTGNGHHIHWIVLPKNETASISRIVDRIAGVHPIKWTELKWEHLLR